nr:unknown [Pieris rapae granulovirus]
MTFAIDSQNCACCLYKKYVILYEYIDILERDLPPPRINCRTSSAVYPALPAIQTNYNLINSYCARIFAQTNKKSSK